MEYIKLYSPGAVIINSSVAPGTTRSIAQQVENCHVVYSPVRGMPKNGMMRELKRWTKFVAGVTPRATVAAERFFESIGVKVVPCRDPTALELGKLLETTYRAVMIAAFQEFHRICSDLNVCLFDVIELIADDDRHLLDRPVMYPGVIGGTCLMPNLQLLCDSLSFPSDLLQFVQKSNDLRRQEMRNSKVAEEAEIVELLKMFDEVHRLWTYYLRENVSTVLQQLPRLRFDGEKK